MSTLVRFRIGLRAFREAMKDYKQVLRQLGNFERHGPNARSTQAQWNAYNRNTNVLMREQRRKLAIVRRIGNSLGIPIHININPYPNRAHQPGYRGWNAYNRLVLNSAVPEGTIATWRSRAGSRAIQYKYNPNTYRKNVRVNNIPQLTVSLAKRNGRWTFHNKPAFVRQHGLNSTRLLINGANTNRPSVRYI
jgi:hypothetical protein